MPAQSRKSFRITPFEAKTLSWWRNRRKKIDMAPPYQRRGRLWSDADKAYLIDSILNGYDVPKLYMADFTWGDSPLNSKRLPYAIIDGKQRMEAILDFFDGVVVLNEDFVYLEDPTLSLGGLGYQDLQKSHPEIAELFENYNLPVMSVMAQSDEPISELFVRLNRSKSLTGAEIRNAMSGPAPAVIRQLAGHGFFRHCVRFSVKRGQDLNAAAKLLLFEARGKMGETKKRNLDAFVKAWSPGDRDKLELAFRRALDVLDDMTQLFLPRDQLLGASGVVPVYYWFVRDLTPDCYPRLREFLVQFERARMLNRRTLAESPDSQQVDQQLVEYDRFNRSTNDLRSHEGRHGVLVSRFQQQKPRRRFRRAVPAAR